MHPNPVFHTEEAQTNLAFARARAFGVLAVGTNDTAPLLSHVPFLVDEEGAQPPAAEGVVCRGETEVWCVFPEREVTAVTAEGEDFDPGAEHDEAVKSRVRWRQKNLRRVAAGSGNRRFPLPFFFLVYSSSTLSASSMSRSRDVLLAASGQGSLSWTSIAE